MTKIKSSDSASSVRRRVIANGDTALDDRADISKTVENALVLLNTIALIGPATLGQLATELRLHRTVTHRLLVTLMRQSFVLKFANTYVVGPAILRIGESVLPAFRRVIEPALRQLAAQTRETVSCAVRDGDSWIILDQILDNTHGLHVREEVGARYPLHLGAHGHALLATLGEEERANYLSSVAVSERVGAEILKAGETGYAISDGELRDGITGVAAKGIFRDVAFSIGVIVPTTRANHLSAFIAPLLDAVRGIISDVA